MKYKIIVVLLMVSLLFITGCSLVSDNVKKVEQKIGDLEKNIPLMEYSEFKNVLIDKIMSIDYIRLTETGRTSELITDKDKINSIYNSLKEKNVGKEVTNGCDDNTTIYTFNLSDNKKVNVEIECEWLVINNKRYEIK